MIENDQLCYNDIVMKKGSAQIVIIAAAALLISASLIFAFLQKNKTSEKLSPSTSPAPQYQTNETTNWKTYTNFQYRYSLKYPPNVPINEDKYGVWLDKQIWIQVSLAPESPCRGDCPVDESTEGIKIGELNAKQVLGYIGSMDGIPQRYQRIAIIHKGYLYEIWLYALKFDNDLPFDDSEIKEIPKEEINLFNQILSTFRFVE